VQKAYKDYTDILHDAQEKKFEMILNKVRDLEEKLEKLKKT
jgi:uncharacterized protein YlbG (UPF0298 family)